MRSPKKAGGSRLKNLFLICLVMSSVWLAACDGDSAQPDGLGILNSDETESAAQIVAEANDELKKIKVIYRENEGRIEEVKTAMTNRDSAKIKIIAEDLVLQINDGITFGENAIAKIEKAEELNINETFREYLQLKRESLRKQVDAFEFRRQAAQILSKGSGSSDPREIEGAKAIFREKEESFQKLWQEGREQSQEANLFYKESLKRGTRDK